MSLTPPTVADLANFTGRASSSFGDFATEALTQATLLFYLATDLDNYPTDINLANLAKYGILDMADSLYLSQPYKESTASPFQSETIGSYSYSRLTSSVKKGNATGVTWFDLAVSKLRASASGIGASGSIEGMELDGLEAGTGRGGRDKIVGASGSSVEQSRGAWEIDTWPEVIHHHPIL
jgi:hypothetical protein